MRRSPKTRAKALAAAGAALVAAASVIALAGADSASADPATAAAYGTPVIDGVQDAVWNNSPVIQLSSSSSPITADARFLWDRHYLYALVDVSDSTPEASVSSTGQPGNAGIGNDDDSVDFWINWKDSPFASYYNTTGDLATHYDITRNGVVATNYPAPYSSADLGAVKSAVVSDDTHYVVEAAFPWPGSVAPQPKAGINISVNDVTASGGARSSYITWLTSGLPYTQSPYGLPSVTLLGAQPSGFTTQYVTAPAVAPGGTVHESVAGLWAGQRPAFTKVWGDDWLSVSPGGIVTGKAPAGAAKSAAITVRGSDDSTITVTVPITGR